jgi:H+/gluconate symporter-like permease
MEKDEFAKKMEDLKTPGVESISHYRELKLMMLNARKSAAIGFWFLAIPCYFLFCVFMKYYFHVNLHFFDIIIDMMSDLDKTPGMKFLSPVLLVGLPLVAIMLNALSIMHFQYEKSWKEIKISVRLRWINIFIILVSAVLVCIFLFYVIIENAHHVQNPSYQ